MRAALFRARLPNGAWCGLLRGRHVVVGRQFSAPSETVKEDVASRPHTPLQDLSSKDRFKTYMELGEWLHALKRENKEKNTQRSHSCC